jgi:hypothetical protein
MKNLECVSISRLNYSEESDSSGEGKGNEVLKILAQIVGGVVLAVLCCVCCCSKSRHARTIRYPRKVKKSG